MMILKQKKILQENGYHLEPGERISIVLEDGRGIEEAIKQLTEQNILIQDIVHQDSDLEKVVLDLLKG